MDIVTYALLNGKIKDYASNVDEWLEENVDPATGYVLDRSLQMENAAAPADMVGDINDDVGDLKNTLNQLDAEKADEASLAYRRSGATNTGAQIESGTYFYLDGTLKRAIATIAQNASFTAQNCETVTDGGLNSLRNDSGVYYCKMPDGTLIQGRSAAGVSSGDTITFPEVFSEGIKSVQVTPQYNTGTTIQCIFSVSGITNSKFEVHAFDATTGAISTSSTLAINWLAFGRWK